MHAPPIWTPLRSPLAVGIAALTARAPLPDPAARVPLTVIANPCGNSRVIVLSVAGEIDLVTVDELRGHLNDYLRRADRGVVLDCTAVSFLAACGLGVLADTVERARADGMVLCLVVGDARPVRRALEAAGLTDTVPQAPTVEAATVFCAS